MRRAVVWLFHALVIIVPFAFTAVNEELFEFNKMMLVYAFTALIASAWAVRMVREKRLILEKTPLFLPLMLFLLTQVLSTLTSIHPQTSIFGYYSRFHGGLLSTLAYLTLYFAAVSNLRREDLRPLVRSTVFAGILAALYAFPEHFGVSPSCVLITGEFSVSCWVQDVQTRVFGTFGQPNWLAAYLLVLLPLSAWLWRTGKNQLDRLVNAASFPLFFTVLLFTRSRSGFIGFLVGLAVLALHQSWRPIVAVARRGVWPKINWRSLAWPLGILGSLLLLGLVFSTPYTPSLQEFIAARQPAAPAATAPEPAASPQPVGTVLDTGGTNSGEIRRIVWRGAVDVWRRYPIFGSGVETFAYSYYLDRPVEHNLVSEWDFLYNKAHSEFFNALATTGALGLGALLLLMAAFSWQLWRDKSLFAGCLLAGYSALAVSNALGFSTVMVGVLFFLLPAWFHLNRKSPSQPEKPTPPLLQAKQRRPSRQAAAEFEFELDSSFLLEALIVFITLVAVFLVYRTWQNDRLLASAKRQVLLGQATEAYQFFRTLTNRAPGESLYWDESALFYSRLAAAAGPTEASLAAQLASEAVAATDRAVAINPVHLSYWKSRTKVFLVLATLDPRYQLFALEAIDQAARLAPTDPKNYLNRALILDSLGRTDEARAAFEKAIELKPNYDQAKEEYDKFRLKIASQAAQVQ